MTSPIRTDLEPVIHEMSRPGLANEHLPACDVPERPAGDLLPKWAVAGKPPALPEMGELSVVRHFTRLSQMNFSVDTNFYPLGSCTMKYNPKTCDVLSILPEFRWAHPYQDDSSVQGMLEAIAGLESDLAEVSGMDAISLQPAAGAHGELTALLVIKAYHESKGQKRTKVLIPDSAHGTNPASCTIAGLETVQLVSNRQGLVDLADLEKKLAPDVAALMITNPNTLGIFEKQIVEISTRLHDAGALLYMDGANLNALLGQVRPGDFGVDVMHFNLHKTFAVPHGGGGPGAGPIGVKKHLEPFLPVPRIEKRSDGSLGLTEMRPQSVGRVRSFYGSTGALLRAYVYIRQLGREGLKAVSENAVLNANYLLARLKGAYDLGYQGRCLHEFVLTVTRQRKEGGAAALDIAKRLLEMGFYAPTIYFPLIVPEAVMVEPTETESKRTLDRFAEAMLQIAQEAKAGPDRLKQAPTNLPVRRLDEVGAARNPVLRWMPPA